MILISDLKIPLGDMHENFLWNMAAKTLKVAATELKSVRLAKKSVDARKRTAYTLYVQWNAK